MEFKVEFKEPQLRLFPVHTVEITGRSHEEGFHITRLIRYYGGLLLRFRIRQQMRIIKRASKRARKALR